MDRIVRINVTKNERNVTLNVVNNVIKIIVSQNSGGGGGSGITTLTSSGGTITITGSPTAKNLELSSSLVSLINSALQDAPNNANAYVRSGLSWVIGYTKSAIDSLLTGKANTPTGTPDGTKYLRDDNTWQFLIDATPTVKGIAKLYTSLGSNTDGAVDQNTVNSALELKANLQNVEQIIRSKSNGTFGSHTGDTAETVIAVINIDANEFEAGDWMTLLFSGEKDATVGNITWRLRAGVNGNTSDSQIATLTATSGNSRYCALYRARPQFLTGNQLRIWSSGSAAVTDIGVSGAPTLASLTPTSAWKLTVTAQLAVSTETASLTGYRIGKIKSF